MRAGETMNRRRIAAAVVAFLAVLSTGCLVEIHHGGDVEAAFRTARAEVERDRGRRGAVHRLNVLVFDPSSSVLLAEGETTLAGNSFGYPAGTRIESITYLETAVVDSLGARP